MAKKSKCKFYNKPFFCGAWIIHEKRERFARKFNVELIDKNENIDQWWHERFCFGKPEECIHSQKLPAS